MSEPIKHRIFTNVRKVRAEERQRVSRIQEVLKSAFSQVVTEIKEGSGEIRAIAQTTFSAPSPMETPRSEPTQSGSVEPVLVEIVPNDSGPAASAQPEFVASASTGPSPKEPFAGWAKASVILDAVWDQLIADLRQRARTSQRLAQFKTWLGTADARLSEQYGDRYSTIKARWEHLSAWYQTTSAQAATIDPDPLQMRQTAAQQRAATAGTRLAQQEQRLKERIKRWF